MPARGIINRIHALSFKKLYLLKSLAVLLCFVIFPLIIADSGIRRILEIYTEKRIERLERNLRENLGVMQKFADGLRPRVSSEMAGSVILALSRNEQVHPDNLIREGGYVYMCRALSQT